MKYVILIKSKGTSVRKLRKIIKEFVPFVQKYLKLKHIPRIKFFDSKWAEKQKTFGRHRHPEDILLEVENRQPVDILRTLAHELVHHKQNLSGKEGESVPEGGLKKENKANKAAGIIIRNYVQKHANLFTLGPVK